MSNLIKNEVDKLSKKKSILFIFIIYLIYSILVVNIYYKMLEEGILSHIDSNIFVELFSTDFLNKPILPLGSIIIGLCLLDVFINDYSSGNMKFQVMKIDDRKHFILSKLFSQFITYFVLVLIMYLIAQVVGVIAFTVNLNPGNFFSGYIIYNLNILPSLVVINLANLIYAISSKDNLARISLITLLIVLGIIARSSGIGKFLPVLNYDYLLGFFDSKFDLRFLNNQLLALIYLLVLIFINSSVWSKKEYHK